MTNYSKGDYVLATKYSDGDPQDQWCVGFYVSSYGDDRHLVDDGEGVLYRANGFRRVRKLSIAEGAYLLSDTESIRYSNQSLWKWLREFKKVNKNE